MTQFSEDMDYSITLNKLKTVFSERWADNKSSPVGDLSEYEQLAVVGTGSYGTVKLCRHPQSRKSYAVKVLLKADIIKNKQQKYIKSEKRALQSLCFPLTVFLEFSLKDNDCLYLALPFINGGEMFGYLRKCKKFDENKARFYAAQIFLGLEYLHHMNLVYRDLKPENVLLDHRGYIKLTDFGFCKVGLTHSGHIVFTCVSFSSKHLEGRTWTLCGTPEYIAPEIIKMKGYGKSVDWWAFGIFLYEMVAGVSPFFTSSEDPMILFAKIIDCKYKIPSSFSHNLRNLIYNLLQADTTRRFGNLKNGAKDIKTHNWFKEINWIGLLNGIVVAPYVPKARGVDDPSNFGKHSDMKYTPSKYNQFEREFEDF